MITLLIKTVWWHLREALLFRHDMTGLPKTLNGPLLFLVALSLLTLPIRDQAFFSDFSILHVLLIVLAYVWFYIYGGGALLSFFSLINFIFTGFFLLEQATLNYQVDGHFVSVIAGPILFFVTTINLLRFILKK